VNDHLKQGTGNVARGSHWWGKRAGEAVERCRDGVFELLGDSGAKRGSLAFTSGTTDGIRRAALDLILPTLRDGDEIVIPLLDHRATVEPWSEVVATAAQSGRRITLVPMPYDSTGDYNFNRLTSLLTPRTRLVVGTHIHHVFGAEMRISAMRDVVGREIPILLDAAQSVGHIPVNVRELDVDIFAFSSHKTLAYTGLGAVWTRDERLPRPRFGGLEGTPNILGALSLSAAIDWLRAADVGRIAEFVESLTTHLAHRLIAIPDIELAGRPGADPPGEYPPRSSLVSFRHRCIPAMDLGFILENAGVSVRADSLCQSGRPSSDGLVRASLHVYNTVEEVDHLADLVEKLQ
ncbi:MAG: aminotransferase class V-fold PLP-dependent enzyme, partial [Candidatus Dormibacteraceae bacterium]